MAKNWPLQNIYPWLPARPGICDHLHIYNVWPVFTNANGKQRNESFLLSQGEAESRELREESQGVTIQYSSQRRKIIGYKQTQTSYTYYLES